MFWVGRSCEGLIDLARVQALTWAMRQSRSCDKNRQFGATFADLCQILAQLSWTICLVEFHGLMSLGQIYRISAKTYGMFFLNA